MPDKYKSLTEKEKETLRLLVRGYDAKSMARHFQLSVHTINERLRNARAKMSVSSSREAARLLLDKEENAYNFHADTSLGEAAGADRLVKHDAPTATTVGHGPGIPPAMFILITGVFIMSLLLATLAYTALSQNDGPTVQTSSAAPDIAIENVSFAASDVVQSARTWLALVDARDWSGSWKATGTSFRELNTEAVWADTASKVQPPFGATLSRVFKSEEDVPAPPAGYKMLKFQTQFANRPDTIETLTLEREDNAWKVVGYWID